MADEPQLADERDLAALDDLTARQEKAIVALLREPTVTAAAAAVGLGERTIFTWLQDPLFVAAYRAARREAVSQAIAQLQGASQRAVRVLCQVMDDPKANQRTRILAANSVLNTALRAIEIEDLAERLAALEAALHEDT